MNILTDEEILAAMTPECVEGDWYLPQTFARAIEAAVLEKLAAQDVEPIYQLCKANSSVSSAWIDVDGQTYIDAGLYQEYGRRRLYTEAQLLAVQQRTAEACAKLCGEMISPSKPLSDNPCQAWMAGTLQCAEAIRNGEWRNYK